MAKILRKVAKIFGSTAGASQIAEFGSLAAASPAFSTDPDTIQSLSNWLQGWFSAVIGANSPAIEDMNAFCYVMAYQIAYIMQAGVPEWNSATTYYIGSLANDGTGSLFASIQNNNVNHALSDPSWWVSTTPGSGDLSTGTQTVSTDTTLTNVVDGKALECDTSNASFTLTLPASPTSGLKFHIKDSTGSFGRNPLTINPNGKSLEGLTSNYVAYANWWDRVVYYDGTSYFLL